MHTTMVYLSWRWKSASGANRAIAAEFSQPSGAENIQLVEITPAADGQSERVEVTGGDDKKSVKNELYESTSMSACKIAVH